VRRRRAALACAALACAALLGALAAAPGATASPAAQRLAPQPLELVSQKLDVAVDSSVELTVRIPPVLLSQIDSGALERAQLVVTSHERVQSRSRLDDAVSGGAMPDVIDSVRRVLRGPSTPPPPAPPANELFAAADGAVGITLAVETATRTRDALQLSNPGLVPITVELRVNGDEALASVLTFINRLPASDNEQIAPLGVSLAAGTTGDVALGNTEDPSAIVVTDDTRTEIETLISALNSSENPAFVSVPAALIADLGSTEPALAARLTDALARHTLLAGPRWPLNPSAAAEAGKQPLYTDWLRRGEDASVDAGFDPTRAVVLHSGPLGDPAALMLRNLGGRLVLLTSEQFDALQGARSDLDTSGTFSLTTNAAPTLDALVVDRRAAAFLDQPSDDATRYLDTVYVVADMIARRSELSVDGLQPSRHTVLLGNSALGVPDPGQLDALTAMIETTTALEMVGPDRVVSRTEPSADDGGQVSFELPDSVAGDDARRLTERVAQAEALRSEAAAVTSMLTDGDSRSPRWTDGLSVFPSTAFTDEQIAERDAQLRGEFAAILGAVQLPAGYTFNLAGQRSVIRIRLTNNDAQPLRVRVRMSTNKLLFPEQDQIETLPPNATTEVEVPVQTRSGGKFPVALEVFTPAAGNVRVGAPVYLTAKVNALNGRGTAVSRIGIALLALWWARTAWHTRAKRRQAAMSSEPAPAGTLPGS
jgi:hypothetical protein